MKYAISVLVMVAVWLPTAVLTYKAVKTQKFLDTTPGFQNEINDHESLAWVVGTFSMLITIFAAIFSLQNNWL